MRSQSRVTPWKLLEALPCQASCRALSLAIMALTLDSISAEMRVTSPDAAWMRAVSTWNLLLIGLPFVSVGRRAGCAHDLPGNLAAHEPTDGRASSTGHGCAGAT